MKVHAAAYTLAVMLTVFGACWGQASAQHVGHRPVAHRRHIFLSNTPTYRACASGAAFVANKVRLLGRFDLQRNGASGSDGSYVAPTLSGNPPTAVQTDPLENAWDIAPKYLQDALCEDVDWVFIDPDNQAPWGWSYWEEATLNQGSGGGNGLNTGNGVFIAIGANLLAAVQGTSPLTVSQLEFDLVRRLFTTATPKLFDTGAGKRIQVTVSNPGSGTATGQETVLSVLAREMGFVTEHELTRRAGSFPPCVANQNATFNNSFYNTSWSSWEKQYHLKPELGRIHTFGKQTGGLTPKNTWPTLSYILNEMSPASAAAAIKDVEGIYEGTSTNPSEWADFLAYRAPIEDFVETFRLWALYNAEVNSQFKGQPGDHISNITVYFNDGSTTDVLFNLTHPGTPLSDQKLACMKYLLTTLPSKPPTN